VNELTPAAKIWASRLAKVCVVVTLILILAGAVVTTAGAGMVSPNAPHVGGRLLFPSDMWTSLAGFFEHSHRHIAMLAGLCIGILCTLLWRNWTAFFVAMVFMGAGELGRAIGLSPIAIAHLRIWPAMVIFIVFLLVVSKRRRETPSTEQWLALVAFIAACMQAVFGALRVEIETSGNLELATNTRIVHGVFAQAVLVVLVVLAARLSPVWAELRSRGAHEFAPKFRRMAIAMLGLYFVQLALAAYLRHKHLGLAIPTWPQAQPDGSWLPVWTHITGIHFLHSRVMPFLILGHGTGLAISLAKRSAIPRLTRVGWLLFGLIAMQIILGVLVIWKGRHAHITNTHVITGALICAATALLLARTRALLPARA
jgi:heme A synthase